MKKNVLYIPNSGEGYEMTLDSEGTPGLFEELVRLGFCTVEGRSIFLETYD